MTGLTRGVKEISAPSFYLQGTERDTEVKGRLFLRAPRGRPLQGVDEGDILEVVKSVYGLPDAPRAWWEEVITYLRDIGFQHSRMDPAFMVFYHPNGNVGAMLVVHVDDVMLATDGSKDAQDMVDRFHKRFPFGEWEVAGSEKALTYTGRSIQTRGKVIHIGQEDFINGRMDELPVKVRQKD